MKAVVEKVEKKERQRQKAGLLELLSHKIKGSGESQLHPALYFESVAQNVGLCSHCEFTVFLQLLRRPLINSRFLDVFRRHVPPYSQNLVVVHHGEELSMETDTQEGNGTEAKHKDSSAG